MYPTGNSPSLPMPSVTPLKKGLPGKPWVSYASENTNLSTGYALIQKEKEEPQSVAIETSRAILTHPCQNEYSLLVD